MFSFAKLDRSTAAATIATLSKTGPECWRITWMKLEFTAAPKYAFECGSHQRQHQKPSSKGPRLHKISPTLLKAHAYSSQKQNFIVLSESGLNAAPTNSCGQSRILWLSFHAYLPTRLRWGYGAFDVRHLALCVLAHRSSLGLCSCIRTSFDGRLIKDAYRNQRFSAGLPTLIAGWF